MDQHIPSFVTTEQVILHHEQKREKSLTEIWYTQSKMVSSTTFLAGTIL